MQKLERLKEKGAYFEGSGKKYPEIDLPKWMQNIDEEEQS